MNRLRRLAITATLASALALGAFGMASAIQAGPAYLAVGDWYAGAQGNNLATLTATTGGQIPKRPDDFVNGQLIVGIAWVDVQTMSAVVATIHPELGRDSHQRPDAWHLHTAVLAGGATSPNDLCLVSVSSTPTAGIQISGSTMRINIRASELPFAPDAPDLAAGFTVHTGDAGCATGLGVRVRS